MTPTIEEVKRVCEQYGMFPPSNFTALQAFAQHYIEVGRKEQQEIDAQYLEGMSDGADECATAIRNNTGE